LQRIEIFGSEILLIFQPGMYDLSHCFLFDTPEQSGVGMNFHVGHH
jgi:hypothetical protein